MILTGGGRGPRATPLRYARVLEIHRDSGRKPTTVLVGYTTAWPLAFNFLTISVVRKQLVAATPDFVRLHAKVLQGQYAGVVGYIITASPKYYTVRRHSGPASIEKFRVQREHVMILTSSKERTQYAQMVADRHRRQRQTPQMTSMADSIYVAQYLPVHVAHPEFSRSKQRGIGALRAWAKQSGKLVSTDWLPDKPMFTVAEETEFAEAMEMMSSKRNDTLARYRSTLKSYELFCRRRRDDVDRSMFPLTKAKVGPWLYDRWKAGLATTVKNTGSSLVHLRHFATEAGFDLEHIPRGIHPIEKRGILEVRQIIADLTEDDVNKAYPMTGRMLHAIRAKCNFTKSVDQRNFTYWVTAQATMLRHQDHRYGKTRRGHIKRMSHRGAPRLHYKFLVPPGKAHKGYRDAALTETKDNGLVWGPKSGPIEPARYMQWYMERAGLIDAADDAYVFPLIDSYGTRHYDQPADSLAVLAWARAKLTDAGYPAAVVNRITWHSARAGGATELYRRGLTERQIKRQGRWASNCVRSYMRLSVVAVHDWLAQCPASAPRNVMTDLRADNAEVAARLGGSYDQEQETANAVAFEQYEEEEDY